jgi:lysophospholipase L1-like esterase
MGIPKLKIIGINLLVFFVLFNVLYWSVPTLNYLLVAFAPEVAADSRGRLPNYANVNWAPQHYREFRQLKFDYKSFIGWRHEPFHGETINIGGPYAQRLTINHGTATSKKAYFFGGSTMWGVGVRDDGTLPSQFAAATGTWSENFGELSWTAHQSLTLLVQLLQDGHRPDIVVFYDGVNDVGDKCRAELTPYSDAREAQFDDLFKNAQDKFSFHSYFSGLQSFAAWVRFEISRVVTPATAGGPRSYDCDSKPEKATKIAENLLADWKMAEQLVASYGGRFIGILQPIVYFSQTRHDLIRDDPDLRAQYQAVYPLVERLIEGGPFHNMVRALDVDEYIYVDYCHLSPNGNALIAARIAEIIDNHSD